MNFYITILLLAILLSTTVIYYGSEELPEESILNYNLEGKLYCEKLKRVVHIRRDLLTKLNKECGGLL